MASPRAVQTFMFIDFECVKLDTNNLTAVSLLAAPRILYLDSDIEEPTDKLTLDLSPNGFNLNTYNAINNFINQQKKPVCLVSLNGNRFEFPILKRELQKLKVSLIDDVLCADSLFAYYDILEHPDEYEGSAVRNVFWEAAYSTIVSYRLEDIYNREVTYPPVTSYPPENNNIMNFRISRKLAERFLAWTDQIQREFANVQPQEIVILS